MRRDIEHNPPTNLSNTSDVIQALLPPNHEKLLYWNHRLKDSGSLMLGFLYSPGRMLCVSASLGVAEHKTTSSSSNPCRQCLHHLRSVFFQCRTGFECVWFECVWIECVWFECICLIWVHPSDFPSASIWFEYGWPEPYINGVYTVFLAGKSPNIRSYTVFIYGSGQP